MNVHTKRVRPRYRKHRVKANAKAPARGTQKVWHMGKSKDKDKDKDKGRRTTASIASSASTVSPTHLSLHDATLKVRRLYDTVRDFDVESIYKWRNMRKRIQRGKPVHEGGGPAEDAQANVLKIKEQLDAVDKLQTNLKKQLDDTIAAIVKADDTARGIKNEMDAAKEGATPDDPDCVEYQGQPTFLVKKKPGGPDEYDVTRVSGDTHVDGSLTRLAESLIGRAKEVGGVDEDGEDETKKNEVAVPAPSLDAIAEKIIIIALDALDKVDAFEGAKQLTDDKVLEQAAAVILAIAVGGLLNKSGSALDLSDGDNVGKLIAAIAPAYTAFYPDDGSGLGPFPEIFKGISSSSSSSSSSSALTSSDSDKQSKEDKIHLLRELIDVYNSSNLSDANKYPNFGIAKTQLQTFKTALG